MQIVAPPKKLKRKARRGERTAPGVALIFVLTTIAILTAIAVDFSYNSRVNLELAVQSRDSLRARSLAMSGMTMARVLLHFQKQVDAATAGVAGQFLSQMMGMMGPGDPAVIEQMLSQSGGIPGLNPQAATGAVLQNFNAPGAAGAAPSGPTIELWKVSEKFDSNMIFNFINSFPMPEEKKEKQPPLPQYLDNSNATPIQANFGEFTGTFSFKITDEDQKINPARLASIGNVPLATVMQLKPLMDSPNYDFIFNEEDHNHDRVTRNDTLAALRDWVDDDDLQTAFDPSMMTGSPFIAGGGDESGPYSRYHPPYRAKNARFDSNEELRMVYGINDAWMAAFGDRMSVYTDINGKLNVNTDDPEQLRSDVLAVAKNPLDPILQFPMLYQVLQMQISLRRRMLPFIGMTVPEFLGLLQADGVILNPDFTTPGSPNNFLDNRSTTFRIVATGTVGRVKKTLTAVVRYDDGLGQLLYWHED